MAIKINRTDEDVDLEMATPHIAVFGVGGAGCNAINNMIQGNLEGVHFVATNTDAQTLLYSKAPRKLQLGKLTTQGLGAGARPEVGEAAAEESLDEIIEEMRQANMVFITAGMGGGTGTGAAPVIARIAKEQGILTVGVITKPFEFEGRKRMAVAEAGIAELAQYVDTLVVVPNQNLFHVANERTTFADAFKMADDVLYYGVRSITDLMTMPGLINLDFADVKAVMLGMGKAMMGAGEASGERRALDAAELAIRNPLLDDSNMTGARGLLINITGGRDLTLFEVDEAANRIRQEADADANIIFGSCFDDTLDGVMRVSIVATGIMGSGGSPLETLQKKKAYTETKDPFTPKATPSHEGSSSFFSFKPAAKPESMQQDEEEYIEEEIIVEIKEEQPVVSSEVSSSEPEDFFGTSVKPASAAPSSPKRSIDQNKKRWEESKPKQTDLTEFLEKLEIPPFLRGKLDSDS